MVRFVDNNECPVLGHAWDGGVTLLRHAAGDRVGARVGSGCYRVPLRRPERGRGSECYLGQPRLLQSTLSVAQTSNTLYPTVQGPLNSNLLYSLFPLSTNIRVGYCWESGNC